MVGRGSFTESFPLFGYDMQRSELLSQERLPLFAAHQTKQPVTWSGRTRSPLSEQRFTPQLSPGRSVSGWRWRQPRVGDAGGGYGLPIMLAIIGGEPGGSPRTSISTTAGASRSPEAARRRPFPRSIAATDEQAREERWPHYGAMMDRIGPERGWTAGTRGQFEARPGRGRALRRVARDRRAKISATNRTLGLSRFDLKSSTGRSPTSGDELHRAVRRAGRAARPDAATRRARRPATRPRRMIPAG